MALGSLLLRPLLLLSLLFGWCYGLQSNCHSNTTPTYRGSLL